MSTFDNREKAAENKFVHDKELEFKIVARRRKLLALWAADMKRLDEEKSLEYALDVVRYGIENKEDGAVVNRILSDLNKQGINISESEIREKMGELHAQATHEIHDAAE